MLAHPDGVGGETACAATITDEYAPVVRDAPALLDDAQPQIKVFDAAQTFVEQPRAHDRVAPCHNGDHHLTALRYEALERHFALGWAELHILLTRFRRVAKEDCVRVEHINRRVTRKLCELPG